MITLSGGDFGGTKVKKENFINGIYEAKDKQGQVWVYDLNLSVNPQEATFKGMIVGIQR